MSTRQGKFEEGDEGGRPVFRLRWPDDTYRLSAVEIERASFVRYLIDRGTLGELMEVGPSSAAEA